MNKDMRMMSYKPVVAVFMMLFFAWIPFGMSSCHQPLNATTEDAKSDPSKATWTVTKDDLVNCLHQFYQLVLKGHDTEEDRRHNYFIKAAGYLPFSAEEAVRKQKNTDFSLWYAIENRKISKEVVDLIRANGEILPIEESYSTNDIINMRWLFSGVDHQQKVPTEEGKTISQLVKIPYEQLLSIKVTYRDIVGRIAFGILPKTFEYPVRILRIDNFDELYYKIKAMNDSFESPATNEPKKVESAPVTAPESKDSLPVPSSSSFSTPTDQPSTNLH